MNHASFPVELTHFIPETITLCSGTTWRLEIDRDKETVEIKTKIHTTGLITTIVAVSLFVTLIIGFGLWFAASLIPQDFHVKRFFMIMIPFCGYSAVVIICGALIAMSMKNAASGLLLPPPFFP